MNSPWSDGHAREHRPSGWLNPPPDLDGPGRALRSRAALFVLRARATVPEHGREAPASISARA
jgi:hypothetical protein